MDGSAGGRVVSIREIGERGEPRDEAEDCEMAEGARFRRDDLTLARNLPQSLRWRVRKAASVMALLLSFVCGFKLRCRDGASGVGGFPLE